MKESFLKLAKGFEMIAEGYRQLASGEVSSLAVQITVEEVRAVLASKTCEGKTKQVRELLHAFGADKLSGVSADQLAQLKERAERL